MTFDSAINTDLQSALADLRDKVGGMTNWTVTNDTAAGAAPGQGDHFVFKTPTGEYIRMLFQSSNEGDNHCINAEYGPDYDTTNDGWTDRYPNDPNGRGLWNNNALYVVDTDANAGATDAVTYWLEYVDGAGFGLYIQREEADGKDSDALIGFNKINKLWDYDAAASRESDYAYAYAGHHGDNNYSAYTCRMAQSASRPHERARGQVNPDDNYDNYPYTEGIHQSSQYRNTDGRDAIIGTYNMMLYDESGGDAAHRDTVQDSNGNNVYTILKRNHVSVALRMD